MIYTCSLSEVVEVADNRVSIVKIVDYVSFIVSWKEPLEDQNCDTFADYLTYSRFWNLILPNACLHSSTTTLPFSPQAAPFVVGVSVVILPTF